MSKKDVLAAGGKKATFAASTGVPQERWDRIFGNKKNPKREQRTSKEDRKFYRQEEE